ncbi:hypothetical protein EDB85DRAFT_1891608 [Lactarius pseudohatsudake]|nr:hypothetical protein EDB85DRAFT_1891608 [Lactarius pseudohatsudake]
MIASVRAPESNVHQMWRPLNILPCGPRWNPGTPGCRILGQSATIPGILGSVTLGKLLRETLVLLEDETQEGKGGAGKGKSGRIRGAVPYRGLRISGNLFVVG